MNFSFQEDASTIYRESAVSDLHSLLQSSWQAEELLEPIRARQHGSLLKLPIHTES